MQVTQAIRPLPFSISYQSAQAHQSIARRILLQPPTELSLLAFLATYEKQIPIARKAKAYRLIKDDPNDDVTKVGSVCRSGSTYGRSFWVLQQWMRSKQSSRTAGGKQWLLDMRSILRTNNVCSADALSRLLGTSVLFKRRRLGR